MGKALIELRRTPILLNCFARDSSGSARIRLASSLMFWIDARIPLT